MFGSFLGLFILIVILSLPLSGVIFALILAIYDIILKHRNEYAKSVDCLYWISFVVAFLLLSFNFFLAPQNSSASQSSAENSKTAKTYTAQSDFEPMPTLNFETLPTISIEDFVVPEMPGIIAESASIEFINYPEAARRNEEVTVKVRGEPYTTYSITVTYSSGVSTADGLCPKTSDSNGYVFWSWKIGGRTAYGSYPITVSGGGISETIYFDVVS